MNNQNDNQTNQSTADQDALNQYASLIKPETDNQPTDTTPPTPNLSEDQSDLFLKQSNSTPIDTPTPVSLDDSLDPSESLSKELKEAQPVNEEALISPDVVSESEPKPESEPEPEPDLAPPEPVDPPKTSTQDPQEIKQKIEEVLSYKSTTNDPSTKTSNQTKPPVSKFIKFFFILSLISFITILLILIFLVLNPKFSSNQKTEVPQVSPTPTSTSTSSQTGVTCELNGFIYSQGQSFPAADGCNTCSCHSSGEIVCTEKACDAESSTSSATESAVISPTVTSDLPIIENVD